MRTPLRSTIALSLALGVLVGAAVAAAASGDPTPPIMPVAEQGGSAPGNVGGGSSGPTPEPVAPQEPCGQQPVDPGAGPDTAVSSIPCPIDEPVDGFGHAQMVSPTPGMVDVRPIGWTKAGADGAGTNVTVRFWSGVEPCYVLDHIDVRYGPDAVTITLFQGSDPSAGNVACIEIAQLKETVVTLSEPLAGRQLLDGAAT